MRTNPFIPVSYGQLMAFFIPLGFSASLTSITHLIINGTLARGSDAEFIIACYAVAFSLFGILEKPALVLRQTSSALAKDQPSFRNVFRVSLYVMLTMFIICLLIGYTRLGTFIFVRFFNAQPHMLQAIAWTFRVIMFVIIFSGIRCLYQGLIINHLSIFIHFFPHWNGVIGAVSASIGEVAELLIVAGILWRLRRARHESFRIREEGI